MPVGRPTGPTASTAPRREGRVLHRYPPADGERLATRRARVLLHPHRHDRPLQADARLPGLLPDRLGRQRPATERRVQNYFGVRCDPSLAYEIGFVPPAEGGLAKDQQAVSVSRPNFVELCERLVGEDEKAFESLFRHLGLSVDWTQDYTTIGESARRASQRGFLRLLANGNAYSAEAPTLWDIDFRTAVAQAELEDRERPGAYHRLVFHGPDGEDVLIDTTRPELLAACVAVVAHPDDTRFAALVGRTVRTPVFGVEVPVLTHHLAQPDKGTGMAMICTFGDVTDVIWWRELGLPVRAIIGRDGRLVGSAPEGLNAKAARPL